MNLDPGRFTSAAMGAMPDIEAELQFDVDAAILTGDTDAIWKMTARFAIVDAATLGSIKSKIFAKFGKTISPADLNSAIKEHRQENKRAAAEAAARNAGQSHGQPGISNLPSININGKQLRDITRESMRALLAANDPPSLFIRSGEMVYMAADERFRPSIITVTQDHLRGRLARAANYVRRGETGELAVMPPMEVVRDILALPSGQWNLPALDVVVEVPTLRPDGTVLDTPGYDSASAMLYVPSPDLQMRPIPERPDPDEVDEAVALICDAVGQFPFVAEFGANGEELPNSSLANFLALLLMPIIRPSISGCTPLAIIDAPQAGTGKSLLVDVFAIITTGRPASMMSFPREEPEVRKTIGATLLHGRPLICFDNFEGVLNSSELAGALTSKEYEARILGVSRNMLVQNRATWLLTGNNVRPSGDMPRRCFHIRLDAKSSQPYIGREFTHQPLEAWVLENRGELLRALLLIARSWYANGKRSVSGPLLGSFESWHSTLAGILKNARVPGFLDNSALWLSEADELAVQWENFLLELKARYSGGVWFRISEIADAVRTATTLYPCPFTLPDSFKNIDVRKIRGLESMLGNSFTKRTGRRFGESGLYLERAQSDKHLRVTHYRVMDAQMERDANIKGIRPG